MRCELRACSSWGSTHSGLDWPCCRIHVSRSRLFRLCRCLFGFFSCYNIFEGLATRQRLSTKAQLPATSMDRFDRQLKNQGFIKYDFSFSLHLFLFHLFSFFSFLFVVTGGSRRWRGLPWCLCPCPRNYTSTSRLRSRRTSRKPSATWTREVL